MQLLTLITIKKEIIKKCNVFWLTSRNEVYAETSLLSHLDDQAACYYTLHPINETILR